MQDFGEKCYQGIVCFSVDGWRGECDLYCFGVDACYGVLSCPGVHADCQGASVWQVVCEGWVHQIAAFGMRRPKMAVPTRTQVLPSSMATVKSFDIPMESWVSVGKASDGLVAEAAEFAEVGAGGLGVIGPGWDGHEAYGFDRRELFDGGQESR